MLLNRPSALLQSSIDRSTATGEGHTTLYIKRKNRQVPCKAVCLVETFHIIREIMKERFAVIMNNSQVILSLTIDLYSAKL